MRKLLRPGPVLALVFGLAWVLFVIVEIADDPPKGAASMAELRAATEKALRGADSDEFQRLLFDKTAGDDYAKQFVDELEKEHVHNDHVAVHDDQIRLTATGSAQQAICVQWRTTVDDDRYFLDATPELTSCTQAK